MKTFCLRRGLLLSMIALAALLGIMRAMQALQALAGMQEGAFLALPLTVILPLAAFVFLTRLGPMRSAEGVLMQLGCMIQILLIIAMPGFALYLALGFPVVFLVVELFETRLPTVMRDVIKRKLIL